MSKERKHQEHIGDLPIPIYRWTGMEEMEAGKGGAFLGLHTTLAEGEFDDKPFRICVTLSGGTFYVCYEGEEYVLNTEDFVRTVLGAVLDKVET